MPDYDNMSMKEIFKLDVVERIKTLNDLIIRLEKEKANLGLYDDAMREAHSLKAAARIVNNLEVQNLAHKLEEVLEAVKGKAELTPEHVDLFLEGLDAMSEISQAFVVGMPHHIDVEDLLKRLEGAQNGTFASRTKNADDDPAPTGQRQIRNQRPVHQIQQKGLSAPSDGVREKQPTVDARSPEGGNSTKRRAYVEKAITEKEFGESAVRVGVDKLDNLMNISGEIYTNTLNIEREQDDRISLGRSIHKIASHLDSLKRVCREEGIENKQFYEWIYKSQMDVENFRRVFTGYSERMDHISVNFGHLSIQLQQEVMHARMLPISTIFDAYGRFVRDAGRESCKKIRLVVTGGDTPVDKSILEALKDPLMHLVRNACDHGIELPEERKKQKKHEEGQIKLSAYQQSDRIMIEVEDDGRGIDLQELREKIIEKKLLTEEETQQLSGGELMNFIFMPGFSTASKVTTLSGRGVGLDVVKSNLSRIGGECSVESRKGISARFVLSLPATLSVTKSLLVECVQEIFCIPLTCAKEVNTVSSAEVKTVEGRETVSIRHEVVPIVHLSSLWGMDGQVNIDGKRPLVVIGYGRDKVALWVDRYIGEKEVVSKSLGRRLENLQDIAGGTILDNGQIAFIVDVERLMRSCAEHTGRAVVAQKKMPASISRKKILVVEDSLTVRELEKKVLLKNGYEVVAATDGMEGLDKAKEGPVDLIVTDIDMPRMNGFELIRHLKKDKNLKKIPTIIVSFKERTEDKRMGMEVGADLYITKSKYDDTLLLDAIARLIG